ncbi:MAG TPA: methyltransferase domain-containing protein [Chlamydiales bacterium]|nr:methyltransferase domain-containing protein [Chlamydiales bacterium]
MALSATGMSLTGLFGKIGLGDFTVPALMFWRYALTSLTFVLLVLIVEAIRTSRDDRFRGLFWPKTGSKAPKNRLPLILGYLRKLFHFRHIKIQCIRAFFVLLAQYCFFYYLSKSNLLNAASLLNTGPIFISIIEWGFLGKKVGLSSWVGAIVSFIGALFILQPDAGIFALSSLIGLTAGISQGASQVVFGLQSEREEKPHIGVMHLFMICAVFSFFPFLFSNAKMVSDKYIPKMIQESTFGRVQSAENRFLKRGLVLKNTTPFSRIDFRQLSIPPKGQLLNHFGYTEDQSKMLEEMEGFHFWNRARTTLICDRLKFYSPGKRILDVGCGTGRLVEEFDRQGFTAVGIDPQPKGFARRRSTLRFMQAKAEQLPFPDHSFDAVILADVLEHLEEEKPLTEAFRVLVSGGILLLTVPAFPWVWSKVDVRAGHLRRYRTQDLRSIATRLQGTCLHLEFYQCLLFPLFLLSRWVEVRREKKPFDWMNRLFFRINTLEVFLGKWVRWPWGSSILAIIRKP